jgi:valyl-tRNA synthetase
VVADDWANPEFGTGAVKVTPAHDPNDFAIGQRHKLPSLAILDQMARVDLPGSKYHGLDRYAAREMIVIDLGDLLVEVKEHPMTVPISQRSGSVIEPRLSDQWFLKIQPLADKAIAAVREGHIKFTPEMYAKTYFEWMGNIHDWCISRQLWWGHRIPAWHCGACKAITVARGAVTACGTCGSAEIVQETDVLDTWFSSGLLPFTVFGWPEVQGSGTRDQGSGLNPDLAAFYPTDLLVTGFDILFFWVARMIMLGCHFMLDVPMPDGSARTLADAVPFREVYIHALVRDANREKMSKTKGNVIDPIDIIQRFGTDAVRFTLASMASPGTDIAFSEARTEGYRAFANKIWNAARFLFMNIERAREVGIEIDLNAMPAALILGAPHLDSEMWEGPATVPLEARWILSKLNQTAKSVSYELSQYRFDEAASVMYQFFWGDFCDWYLEIVKLRLNFGEGSDLADSKASLVTLLAVFEAALRLLSPFMPFITEELWQAFYSAQPPCKSIALASFPKPTEIWHGLESVSKMVGLQQVIINVRGLRKEVGVPEKEAAPIRFFGPLDVISNIRDHLDLLSRLAKVSTVEFAEQPLTGEATRASGSFDVQVVYERVIDLAAERERLTKDLVKYEKGLIAAKKQLSNDAFMAKAPAHIVEGLKKQMTETQSLYDKTKAALEALPKP